MVIVVLHRQWVKNGKFRQFQEVFVSLRKVLPKAESTFLRHCTFVVFCLKKEGYDRYVLRNTICNVERLVN